MKFVIQLHRHNANCICFCRANCPLCDHPCTVYNTERIYSYTSIFCKKEAAVHDIERQITLKRMQIKRSINRNKNNNSNELNVLMEETKEIQNKINEIKKRNLRKVQGRSSRDAGKKESPSIVATIKLKR